MTVCACHSLGEPVCEAHRCRALCSWDKQKAKCQDRHNQKAKAAHMAVLAEPSVPTTTSGNVPVPHETRHHGSDAHMSARLGQPVCQAKECRSRCSWDEQKAKCRDRHTQKAKRAHMAVLAQPTAP